METKNTQQESEQMVNRKLSPPFLIKMTSGENNKHCDLYNHGSFHVVRTCADGYKWVDGRVDTIPNDYSFEIVKEKPEIKVCSDCENEFELNFPFIKSGEANLCVRCFERRNIVNREEYRKILREELKYELLQTTSSGSNNKEE